MVGETQWREKDSENGWDHDLRGGGVGRVFLSTPRNFQFSVFPLAFFLGITHSRKGLPVMIGVC